MQVLRPGAALGADDRSLTDLESDDRDRLLVVITKDVPIAPLDYAPADLTSWRDSDYQLRAEVVEHLEDLFGAAENDGVQLRVVSGFRSYEIQAGTHEDWARRNGQAFADAVSARPGHSEHQSGLAVDLDSRGGECYLDACFGDTPEGGWVAQHAHRFGFVISYPEGLEGRTGYTYEPWHVRYVGPRISGAMDRLGIALLQDYLDSPARSADLGVVLGRHS